MEAINDKIALLLGMLPFPCRGEIFVVDPAYQGANSWLPRERVFTKISDAYTNCRSGYGDTILLFGDGATTGMARETATLAWSKNDTHLVGAAYQVPVAGRASVRAASGSNFSPLMTMTGNGCSWWNINSFHGYDDASTQVCWQIEGQRNFFYNCNPQGMGHATAGDQAGGCSLYLHGADECHFERCVIGLTTVPRSTTNCEILVDSAATRNSFENCRIETFADNAGHFWLKVPDSGGMDRYLDFLNCRFHNSINSTATTMTVGASVHASAGGTVGFYGCRFWGATDIVAGTPANVIVDPFYDGSDVYKSSSLMHVAAA